MKFLLLRKPWLATTSSSISALTFIGVLSFLSSQWESASGAVLFVTSKIPFLDMPYEMDETELFIALPVVGFVWGMYIFGILPVKVGGKNLLTSLVTDRLQESGNNSNATEPTCEALTVLDLLRCRFNTTAAADGERNQTSLMNPEESLRYDLLTEIANTLVKLDDNQIEDTLGSGRSSSPLLDGDTNEPDGQWVIGRTIKVTSCTFVLASQLRTSTWSGKVEHCSFSAVLFVGFSLSHIW
ncbi:unnamed protein product [Notodromas monacha]|uniref:Uncharacterized protein n=1 Tax=Notodromas monacha TaxID=399045 RepID=A0A7R9GI11_9CRUS|nr:unnamed protein product [Notodromas monacha]CAG0921930.1 unnamed protein product [Notodromas monacha]